MHFARHQHGDNRRTPSPTYLGFAKKQLVRCTSKLALEGTMSLSARALVRLNVSTQKRLNVENDFNILPSAYSFISHGKETVPRSTRPKRRSSRLWRNGQLLYTMLRQLPRTLASGMDSFVC